jgi:hypothetical protein
MRRAPGTAALWDCRGSLAGTFSGGMPRGRAIAPRTYIYELNRRQDFTTFVTTHYVDETKNRDRDDTASIDAASIDAAAGTLGSEAAEHAGAVIFPVAAGKQFVPRLRAELPIHIK